MQVPAIIENMGIWKFCLRMIVSSSRWGLTVTYILIMQIGASFLPWSFSSLWTSLLLLRFISRATRCWGWSRSLGPSSRSCATWWSPYPILASSRRQILTLNNNNPAKPKGNSVNSIDSAIYAICPCYHVAGTVLSVTYVSKGMIITVPGHPSALVSTICIGSISSPHILPCSSSTVS